MSRDEACGPHIQLCETPNLDFLVPVLEPDSLDSSELLLINCGSLGPANQQSLRAIVRISSACFHPDDESVLELCFRGS